MKQMLQAFCILFSILCAVSPAFSLADEPAQLQLQSVNINTANAVELASMLVGVGEARAQSIIEYRDQNGPFKTLEDLQQVKGLGQVFIEKNKDRIIF